MGDSQANQFLQLLDQCILSEYCIPADNEGLMLKELAPASSCPDIPIKKTGPVRAYTFEPGAENMPYFNKQVPDLTSMCDAVLIYPQKKDHQLKVFVFLCELKSGAVKSGNKNKALKQLQASLLFARFLLGRIELLADQSIDIVYRALICTPKTLKRIKAQGSKTRVTYHENGELKWVAHNASYPIHLQHYCC